MSEFIISYSVEEDSNRVSNSDLKKSTVIAAQNEEEARRRNLLDIEQLVHHGTTIVRLAPNVMRLFK